LYVEEVNVAIETWHVAVVRTATLVPTHDEGELHAFGAFLSCTSTKYLVIASPLLFGGVQLITKFPVAESIDVETDVITLGLDAALKVYESPVLPHPNKL